MARVALPAGWAGALVRQRGPLLTYQWLWLLLCIAGALAAAAPRILSQPVIYVSRTTVKLDVANRYRELYTDGKPDSDFFAAKEIAIELLKHKTTSDGSNQLLYPDLGSPLLGMEYDPQSDGTVHVLAVGHDAAQSQQLANDAAEALISSVRAAGGREIVRILMGSELLHALQGTSPSTPFQKNLRTIIATQSFPLNRPPDIDPRNITIDQLPTEDLNDVTRAFEVRDVELSKIDLYALQQRLSVAAGTEQEQLKEDTNRLRTGLLAIRDILIDLHNGAKVNFNIDMPSPAYRSAHAPPGTEVPRRIAPLLALAALVGFVFGSVGVAIDRSASVMPKLREMWNYRELIRNLVLRDLRVRYKGSALGYLWTQLAPLLLMLVFLFVFMVLLPSGIALYPVFLIVGLLPWNFCAEAVSGGARSVIDNANLIKKVFFPREVLPLVSVLSSLLNYILSLPMMLLVMAVAQLIARHQLNFSWTFAYLPVLLMIQTLFLTGVVLFLSALAVFFRDVVHLIGILIQFWFFLTPVVYSLDSIHVSSTLSRAIRWINPMASLIDFYREILYGNVVSEPLTPTPGLPALDSILRVLLTALIVLGFGYWFFQRRSGHFGEEI